MVAHKQACFLKLLHSFLQAAWREKGFGPSSGPWILETHTGLPLWTTSMPIRPSLLIPPKHSMMTKHSNILIYSDHPATDHLLPTCSFTALPLKRVEWKHSKKLLEQSITNEKLGTLIIMYLHVRCQSILQISNSFQFCWLQHSFLSWAGSTPSRFPYGSGFSNFLQYPRQSRLHRHSCNGFSGLPQRDTLDTCLTSVAGLSLRGRFLNIFLVSLSLKPYPRQILPSSAACWGWTRNPSSITLAPTFHCWYLPSLLKIFFNFFLQFGRLANLAVKSLHFSSKLLSLCSPDLAPSYFLAPHSCSNSFPYSNCCLSLSLCTRVITKNVGQNQY